LYSILMFLFAVNFVIFSLRATILINLNLNLNLKQLLCTVPCTHMWTDLTVLWIGFCLTAWVNLMCLDLFYVCMHFVYLCNVRFSIVTWWGGTGGIQCFDTVGWVIWRIKTVPDMVYDVFSGTLNRARSINRSVFLSVGLSQSWILQKRLNGSICRVECGLGWDGDPDRPYEEAILGERTCPGMPDDTLL